MLRFYSLLMTIAAVAVSSYTIASEDEPEMDNSTKTPPEMALLDNDDDGRVSKEEFDVYREGLSDGEEEEGAQLSAFASFDKDKDGFVSEAELAAHAKYSNPGNGTGTLLENKKKTTSENRQQSNRGGSRDKGNKEKGNRGGGNRSGKDK
ncbi:EF-hand domain-containing protein [Vibrio sinaloensis]|uniref:EF-hand domain-containing protein n=1 Tax=Photobacterium sp. (strain ATCC 43367) TaxID=379097 RepID=UPI0035EBD700